MAQTICVIISTADRERLQAIVGDRNRPQKHVERARIVLASADRGPAQRVAQRLGVSRPTVWRWQQRFAEAGVDGLLRDKTRKPGKAPIPAETTARVVGLTCTQPPHQVTHWTGRAMAKATGLSLRSVRASGSRTSYSRTASALSSIRAIRPLPPNSPTSLGSMSIPQPMLWCSRLMKRARSKRSTAPSQGCRSNRGAARP